MARCGHAGVVLPGPRSQVLVQNLHSLLQFILQIKLHMPQSKKDNLSVAVWQTLSRGPAAGGYLSCQWHARFYLQYKRAAFEVSAIVPSFPLTDDYIRLAQVSASMHAAPFQLVTCEFCVLLASPLEQHQHCIACMSS